MVSALVVVINEVVGLEAWEILDVASVDNKASIKIITSQVVSVAEISKVWAAWVISARRLVDHV